MRGSFISLFLIMFLWSSPLMAVYYALASWNQKSLFPKAQVLSNGMVAVGFLEHNITYSAYGMSGQAQTYKQYNMPRDYFANAPNLVNYKSLTILGTTVILAGSTNVFWNFVPEIQIAVGEKKPRTVYISSYMCDVMRINEPSEARFMLIRVTIPSGGLETGRFLKSNLTYDADGAINYIPCATLDTYKQTIDGSGYYVFTIPALP